MKEPPRFLQPLLHSIETTIISLNEEFPKLSDKDISYAYEQLKNYFDQQKRGKDAAEPLSSSETRQALIDELLNIIDEREEMQADESYINNIDCTIGQHTVPSLPALYYTAFNRLLKSQRNWTKEDGNRGYLSFIKAHVI